LFRKLTKKILTKSPKLYTAVHSNNFERSHKQDFSKLEKKEYNILMEVKKNGYAVIPNFFNKEQCQKCIDDIDHIFRNNKAFVQKQEDLRVFGAEELSKNIKTFFDDSFLNKLARTYNGVPTCCAFTLAGRIETLGKDAQYGSGGPWHRDSYFRQFKSLIYLNDVDENNGPFQLIHQSHETKDHDRKIAELEHMQSSFLQEKVDKIIENDPNRLKTLTGKAGTLVLVDTSIIHRGIPVKNGIRYALTNYFFEKSQINPHLVEHFSPLVSPEKVLNMGKTEK
jgi:hypothetical protein